jgi:hypothetical protein
MKKITVVLHQTSMEARKRKCVVPRASVIYLFLLQIDTQRVWQGLEAGLTPAWAIDGGIWGQCKLAKGRRGNLAESDFSPHPGSRIAACHPLTQPITKALISDQPLRAVSI